MECGLYELLKRYKGQPIEVITESGIKYCGILVGVEGDGDVDLIDGKGRTIHIEARHIEAIIEPRMKLRRFCNDDNCCCEDDDDDNRCCFDEDDCCKHHD